MTVYSGGLCIYRWSAERMGRWTRSPHEPPRSSGVSAKIDLAVRTGAFLSGL